MIKTGIETGVLGGGLIRPTSGIIIAKNIYNRYSDLDAKAFLYATNGVGNQSKDAIYTLVRDLKFANIWDNCLAIYPFAGNSAINFRPNLINPSIYPLTFNGGAIYSQTGYLPNGTSGFANTGINASARLTQNNAHLAFYSRTNAAASNRCSIGAIVGTSIPMVGIYLKTASNTADARNAATGAQSVAVSNTDSRGFYISSKTSSAIGGLVLYKNGVSIGSNSATITTNNYPNANILIGAFSSTYSLDDKECAFASVGLGLTTSQISDYNTIVTNYQIARDRNV